MPHVLKYEGERKERERETQRERERERENTERLNAVQTSHATGETRLSVSYPVPTTIVNMSTGDQKNMPFHRGSVRLLSSSVGISLLAFLIPSCRGRYSSIPNHLNFDDVLNFDNILTIFYCSGVRQAQSHCPSSSRSPFLTSTTLTPSGRSDAGCLEKGRAMAVIRSRALRGRSGCSLLGRGVKIQPRGGLSFG